ncbi:MAG: amidohydrolase family protein [Anaerolineae bacterium]|nr:amidohydrolase family protein [Anaerolineae bacterium]
MTPEHDAGTARTELPALIARLAQGGRYALCGAGLYDGRTDEARPGMAIEIEGSRIARVCPVEALSPELPQVDLAGLCVTPGLIDAHVHSEDWHAPLYLANGVTAVRDVGCALAPVLIRRRQWNAAAAAAPRLVCCGPLLDSPGPTWPAMASLVTSPDQARAMVDRWVAAGVDQIKLYTSLTPECFHAALARAHDHGKLVSTHLQSHLDAQQAIEAGVDGIEHLSGFGEALWPERRAQGEGWRRLWADPQRDRVARLVDLVMQHGVWLPVTRIIWHRITAVWSPMAPEHPEHCYVPSPLLMWWAVYYGRPLSPSDRLEWSRVLAGMQIFTAALIEAGARVIPGSDAPFVKVVPGFGLHDELELLVECGMTPAGALAAATRLAAQALGLDHLVGTIEPGKEADLLVVEGDPTQDVRDLRRIVAVARGGMWFDPAALLRQAADYAATAPRSSLRRFDAIY